MKQKTVFELVRLGHLIAIFLLSTICIVFIIELIVDPFIKIIFFNESYHLPSLKIFFRSVLFIAFTSVSFGLLCWIYEKFI